jgi:hypothetical protein
MTKSKKQKLYAYVDESGQDTKGMMFVVSVLVLGKERETVLQQLEKIEIESGKKNMKWHKSRPVFRMQYLERVTQLQRLKGRIFFEIFSDTKKYIDLTSFTTAKAILKRSSEDYRARVFIDGFKRKELEIFRRGLRALKVKARQIRGVKKDENDAFIRLVDAICGLVRDAKEDNEWARGILSKLKKNKIVTEL